MTNEELERGKELQKEIEELEDNINLLQRVLKENPRQGKLKRFFLECIGKNQIHIDSQGISFGGILKVDRRVMKILKLYFEGVLADVKREFEKLGKGENDG